MDEFYSREKRLKRDTETMHKEEAPLPDLPNLHQYIAFMQEVHHIQQAKDTHIQKAPREQCRDGGHQDTPRQPTNKSTQSGRHTGAPLPSLNIWRKPTTYSHNSTSITVNAQGRDVHHRAPQGTSGRGRQGHQQGQAYHYTWVAIN